MLDDDLSALPIRRNSPKHFVEAARGGKGATTHHPQPLAQYKTHKRIRFNCTAPSRWLRQGMRGRPGHHIGLDPTIMRRLAIASGGSENHGVNGSPKITGGGTTSQHRLMVVASHVKQAHVRIHRRSQVRDSDAFFRQGSTASASGKHCFQCHGRGDSSAAIPCATKKFMGD